MTPSTCKAEFVSPAPPQATPKASIFTRSVWLHAALLIVIALALTYPCLRRGLPYGHSVFTHINYQHYFNQEIAQGDWYPRWIISMNQGLGGGVFFAQYPLPYYIAWGFGKIIPHDWGEYEESRTQGFALALAAILAALATYAWCATFTDRLTAMLAAVVYMSLPYFLTIDLNMRAAIGEFWALAFLPLAFLFIERMAAGSSRAIPGLAVAFALVIVSHLFTAVLLAPVLLIYAVWRAPSSLRVPMGVQVLIGLALATGLAGVYAVPFLFHRQFLHPDAFVLVQGANADPLSQMFSYNKATFPITAGRPGEMHMVAAVRILAFALAGYLGFIWYRSRGERAWLWRSLLALAAVAVLLQTALAGYFLSTGEVSGALILSVDLQEQRAQIFLCTFLTFQAAVVSYWSIRNSRNRRLADFLISLALASFIMMTSWSQMVWKAIPFLWNIQFPWRLNTFLMVATAGLAALAIGELRKAPLWRVLAGAMVAIVLLGLLVNYARLGETRREFASHESYKLDGKMDSARYIYTQGDPNQMLLVKADDDQKLHVKLQRGSGTAGIQSVNTRSIALETHCPTDCMFQVGQFYYPTWQLRDAPAGAELHAAVPGGLMDLSLPAGDYRFILEIPGGWSERFGGWLSLACLLIALLLAVWGMPFPSLRAAVASPGQAA